MSHITADLERIGFSDWFRSRIDAELSASHGVARVVSVQKDSYFVTTGGDEVFAELSGNLLYSATSAIDLPTTGDWVYADFYDDHTHAVIYGVFPRKAVLKRKSSGRDVDIQLVAANVDVAFVIQSLNENFNLRRLERYLVMVNESGIEPIILLSKCDLMPEADVEQIKRTVRDTFPNATMLEFSNVSQKNTGAIIDSLKGGRTYCLLGSSGVGKTTLLNQMMGKELFDTRPVSRIRSKGRHTTTSRQLVQLAGGALIIDTPGMRELGGIFVDEGLEETFSEIQELSTNCHFNDCSHTVEKGCAILLAVETGELPYERHENFLKMKKESDFNQMSYLEKRQKDKNFGKMIKSVKKHKRR